MKPLGLCIMDGIGINEEKHGNAFIQAKKPNFDYLWNNYPHSTLDASGEAVGLPSGQMGNSEVGHLNIGTGRVVYQPLQFINQSIKDRTFFNNQKFLDVINHVKNNNSKLHIIGLLSDGGVHSHIDHLMALIDLVKQKKVKVYYHLILDGRDTLPAVALKYLDKLNKKIEDENIGSIATISGRYYAMDRDNRWERTKRAYDAMVLGTGPKFSNYKEVINFNYNKDITDEFIIPSVLDEEGIIEENDGIIGFNFRPDRLRQLFSAFTNPDFDKFSIKYINNLKLITMMPVSNEVISEYAFQLETIENDFGEYISNKGLKQLRIAETEKYAHVTYFFDGGIEKELRGCEKVLIPSPKVATYNLKPEMSAYEITDKLLKKIDEAKFNVIILNYANGDMVGHTGDLKAAIKGVEVVDECLGKLYKKVKEKEGTLLVTADHGNCEFMLDNNNNVITAHTTNKVPFIITNKDFKLSNGKLSDIAPTMLYLLSLDKPNEMTGNNLIK